MSEDKHWFRIAHREAWIGVGLAVFNFIWWFGFAYGLGGASPSSYDYIFGLPAWFFFSCVLGFIIMVVLVLLVVKFWFIEVPFEEEGGDES
ncbi:sodium:pantothenate symporter [Thalassobacillus devorans]|uniref:Sodium:pantothenate symporter n=1 Tax=Thalassobacillus devorans TaxID=279813 RepID=A0ABQ1NTG8_9BACI|nr:YhdT family protein [Thalassobacillus devorans]NIK28875.1 putative membrane protein YhdT [Thalassobacillus devorans]GGC82929.1 sodium:pantothenate symporter [Thalassobacillus devorans]